MRNGGQGGFGGGGQGGDDYEYGSHGYKRPSDGTDIGRVKCLVCDQVVKQHPVAEVGHGAPGLRYVIKVRGV
jgi:hypothetical protein